MSFLHLQNGRGYAFEGKKGGQEDDGKSEGEKQEVELADNRKLGSVTSATSLLKFRSPSQLVNPDISI